MGIRRATLLGIALLTAAALVMTGASAQATGRSTSRTPATEEGGPSTPTLLNGWTAGPYLTRSVQVTLVDDIVRFRGAVSGGIGEEIFVLGPNMRPGATVYVPVDLRGSANGRLIIYPDGSVIVSPENGFNDAECFTSLEGARFALQPSGSVPITLQNGWFPRGGNTRPPKASVLGGVVSLKGAIATNGTSHVAFTLPVGMRPTKKVYVRVDLCNAHDGRLVIRPNGTVKVQTEGNFSDAQCITSLEGASFTLGPPGTVTPTLVGGWSNSPFNTRAVRASLSGGVVRLRGAMMTAGVDDHAFTLPANMRPDAKVFVQVDLCGASNVGLLIGTDGAVFVRTEHRFADAQCFTSLEGASYVLA